MKFVFRVGAALRDDLHEVCKAESITEVAHLCKPFSRSVGHTAIQKSHSSVTLETVSLKADSLLLSFIYSL